VTKDEDRDQGWRPVTARRCRSRSSAACAMS
jgi:hypothetical protein